MAGSILPADVSESPVCIKGIYAPVNKETQYIFKKLQAFFLNQESILSRYLEITAKEESALLTRDIDKLGAYNKLKDVLEKKLMDIQKVIAPLELLYKQKLEYSDIVIDNAPFKIIKTQIEELKKVIMAGMCKNREILNTQLISLKAEIQKRRVYNPYKSAFKKNAVPAFIDISG